MASLVDMLQAEPTDEEKAAAMAAALRRQQAQMDAGLIGLMSRHPAFAQVGAAQMQNARAQQQFEAEQQRVQQQFGLQRQQAAAMAAARKTDDERAAEALEETKRHNRQVESKPPGYNLIRDPSSGLYYRVNMRDPSAPPILVQSPDGAAVPVAMPPTSGPVRVGEGSTQQQPKGFGGGAGSGLSKAEEGLRKEFMNNPIVKETEQVAGAYEKIRRFATTPEPSAASDMSLIFNFMKAQDPGSTVREGEYASAEQARGVDGRIIALYNKVKDGQKLTPEQRADFARQAETLFAAQMQRYRPFAESYTGLAKGSGIDPSRVVLNLGLEPAARKQINGKWYEKRDGKWVEL